MAGVFLLNPGAIYQIDTDGNPVSGSTEPTLLNVSGALDSIRKRLDVPVNVTGAVGLTGPVTGTVGLSGPVAVSNFPALQVISGSDWIPTVTGSVRISEPITGSVGLSGPITGSVRLSEAALVKLTDGTNFPVAVTPSGTVPSASDRALVVVLSPNQPAIPISSSPATSTTGIAFGRVQYGASAGVLTAVRATVYTEQTANFTGSIKSSNANDTSAGTGARSVIITYYDQSGSGPFTETVTLNGTTAVNLVNTNHCFIEKMEVVTVGSLGYNAGTITLYTGAGGTGTAVGSIGFGSIVSTMGDNRTLWAHHYKLASKKISLHTLVVMTNGNQVAIFHIRQATPLLANTPEVICSDFLATATNGSVSVRELRDPIVIDAGEFRRVTLYVVSNGSNTNFQGSFDYAEE